MPPEVLRRCSYQLQGAKENKTVEDEQFPISNIFFTSPNFVENVILSIGYQKFNNIHEGDIEFCSILNTSQYYATLVSCIRLIGL